MERVVFDLAVPAQRLMSDYPGHFVAMMMPTSILQPPSSMQHAAHHHHHQHQHQPPPSFKILAADAPLRIGHRYRLVSFEEVLTRFSQGDAHGNFSSSTNVNASHTKIITTKEHLKPGRAMWSK